MTREYLFRGIREDNGEWIEGSLLRNEDRCIIVQTNTDFASDYCNWLSCSLSYDVKPETVGQYTGFKDKNGVNIFDADIVQFIYNDEIRVEPVMCYPSTYVGRSHNFHAAYIFATLFPLTAEVIGNLHSNPELLKKD